MTTYSELQQNKAAAIAAKLAKSGESQESYTARTGINPDVIMENGTTVFDVNLSGNAPTTTTVPPGAGIGAGAAPGGVLGGAIGGNYDLGGIDWGLGGSMSAQDLEGMMGGLAGITPGFNLSIAGIPGIGGGGLFGTIGTILGLAGTAYELAQGLGLGEGGGLFGNNLLGGDTQQVTPAGGSMTTGMIDIGGPGLAEPTGDWVILREWEHRYQLANGTKRLHFWLTQRRYQLGKKTGRYVLMYDFSAGTYKSWPLRAPKNAVIGKNMPSHKMIVRLRKNLGKHSADALTILKVTRPGSLKQHRKKR